MADVWLSQSEQLAWRTYLRAHALLDAHLNRQLQSETQLSQADYGVLVHLSEAPDERLRGYELARGLQWEKSRLSHHLGRMERRGLVQRRECPTDGRGAFVQLTDFGRRRIMAAAPVHVRDVRQWFVDLLTPQQLRDLQAINDSLLAKLEAIDSACPGVEACPEANGEDCGGE